MSNHNLFKLPARVRPYIKEFTGRTWILPKLAAWLDSEKTDETKRFFMLQADPGAGKSMLMAWLAGHGPMPENPEHAALLRKIRKHVRGTHFFVAKSRNTTPLSLAQNLANQLGNTIPGYAQALEFSLRYQTQVTININVETNLGSITGIERAHFDSSGQSFDLLFYHPLTQLLDDSKEKILLLVDALDEADADTVELLSQLQQLPLGVHVLFTTRDDPAAKVHFPELSAFDLIEDLHLIQDAPDKKQDIVTYAKERLSPTLAAPLLDELAEKVGEKSDGIFLYGRLVVKQINDAVEAGEEITSLEDYVFPEALSGIYAEFLNRTMNPVQDDWHEIFQPVLGMIAVSEGEGLTRRQLEFIVGNEKKARVQAALNACAQYLSAEKKTGPFQLFHQSLRDYLFDVSSNHWVDAPMRNLQIADYFLKTYKAGWGVAEDLYALQYTPVHLADALEGLDTQEQHKRVAQLVELVNNKGFQGAFQQHCDDINQLQLIVERALQCAAYNKHPDAAILAVEAAEGMTAFFKTFRQGERLFELVREGSLEKAIKRLELFSNIERDWIQISTLALLLTGAKQAPAKVRELLSEASVDQLHPELGQKLIRLVRVALGEEEWAVSEAVHDPIDDDVIEVIFDRMGGMTNNVSRLHSYQHDRGIASDDEESVYLARADAPVLVAYALQSPTEGTAHLKEYITLNAANRYIWYRNETMIEILAAVLEHPDPSWIQPIVELLCTSSLAGSTIDFKESAFLTLEACSNPEKLYERKRRALEDAQKLIDSHKGDSWSHLTRRLAALALINATVLKDEHEARNLLAVANAVPGGFAGFRTKACLALANTWRICDAADTQAYQDMLTEALRMAHRIQDPQFCMQTTSRINAIIQEAWLREERDISALVALFIQNPDAAVFSAIHIVGEQLEHRDYGAHKMAIPAYFKRDFTLEGIAHIYKVPVSLLMQRNAHLTSKKTDDIATGTSVYIPDADIYPFIAAHLSAEVLTDVNLDKTEKTRLIQGLVPLAAKHTTFLDSVLANLLMAYEPSQDEVLEQLRSKISIPGVRDEAFVQELIRSGGSV